MAILITLKGPQEGQHFSLDQETVILGRHPDSTIYLDSQAVSRHHARIVRQKDTFVVEDLHSSNGTFVNGLPITGSVPLTEKDTLQVGPYLFALRRLATPSLPEESLVIRQQINAAPSSHHLPGQDPAHKLRVILEISQHLGRTLDLEDLLTKLLDHLMQLFPQADRAMVLLAEGDNLVVRSQRCRDAKDPTTFPYSRTIVKRALEEGIGILSEDARADQRFQSSETLMSLNLRSLLCVPLITQENRRLGILQLDRFRATRPFQMEDLQLLTAVAIQVAVVLDNAALHAEILREERLHKELAMAREIQQGFLPTEFPNPDKAGFELFARLQPAREVAGDLYDFFFLRDGRLAFFLGDVSGKGMPAALFMVAVRTLARHLASSGGSPAETMRQINSSIATDNPFGMFVTLAHGIYQPATGEMVLASGGHPLPLLRHADGRVEEVSFRTGRLLGYGEGNLNLSDFPLTLAPEETIVFYTDGFTEAQAADGKSMFGEQRLQEAVGGLRTKLPLRACADYVQGAVRAFTGTGELQDDQTLLLLRRT